MEQISTSGAHLPLDANCAHERNLLSHYVKFDLRFVCTCLFVCLFLLPYVPSQQLWSLRDGQFPGQDLYVLAINMGYGKQF